MNVERFVNGFFFVDVFFSKSSLNKINFHGTACRMGYYLIFITSKQTNKKIKETTSPKVEERVITTNGIIVV